MSWTRRQILKAGFFGAGAAAGTSAGAIAGLRTNFAANALKFTADTFRRLKTEFQPTEAIKVRILGPSSAVGHRVRDGFIFPAPSSFKTTDVLILGGGMSGLSAAWRLDKKGIRNFQVIELESEVGGNSRSGENAVSKYPWGAHYVTMLNDEADSARELFEDLGIITGYDNKRPIYNEYFLCQAPHERLFILDKWQSGLLPKIGNRREDDEHARAFFAEVERFKYLKGRDGKFAFNIPLDLSSRDPEFLQLDQLTMQTYLKEKGWTSQSLNWYVNYCCRDDFGTPHSQTSAWAGLHYFSSRRGHSESSDGSSTLTWPEGNGWIVNQLRARLSDKIVNNQMAVHVEQSGDHVIVDCWNESTRTVTRWTARSVISSMPRFIFPHLAPKLTREQRLLAENVVYSPWMVANITLKSMPAANVGAPISWDNVFYESQSLGYVVTTHQRAAIHVDETVWTYYQPLDQLAPAEARRTALTTSAEEWKRQIIDDLTTAHPEIETLIASIDVWVWGHAMVRPGPGFIWGQVRERMAKAAGRIHFAHSDMSGISIFEEANYHGVRAADEVIKNDLA